MKRWLPYENCRLGGTNHNIPGLSFGKQEVLERVDNKVAFWNERSNRVVFAARFDARKTTRLHLWM